ncbi:MAG: transglycosylase SLT domain-containing protein [Patescibacteria group bacterium]
MIHTESAIIAQKETRPQSLEEMIRQKARANNLNEEKIIFIAQCESQIEPEAIGDGNFICGKTNKPMHSRGIWQINECSHPEISDEQAFDPEWSTDWAIEIFNKGDELKEWRRCTKKWYNLQHRK